MKEINKINDPMSYPLPIKIKFLFYILSILLFIYLNANALVNDTGFGILMVIFQSIFFIVVFVLLGLGGARITKQEKDKMSISQFEINKTVDTIVMTGITPVIIGILLSYFISSINGVQHYFESSAGQKQEQAYKDYDNELLQNYDYYTQYFKQPKHVKYVMEGDLVLDDGLYLSFKGVDYRCLSVKGVSVLNDFLKKNYLDKTFSFILPSKEVFIQLHGVNKTGPITPEENKISMNIPQTRSKDSRKVYLSGVPDISILNVENPLPDDFYNDTTNFDSPLCR